MCGICGQFNFADRAPVDSARISQMMSLIAHRGPDDQGAHLDGVLGLGFRRLSIIDLGGGHQPMADREQSVWVVFNGEIYNFPELKKELQSYGHVFRTRSDTEVIVHGYKQWGEDVLDHLNGMFGLAIWDPGKRQLMLARDRMGIKPIYYRVSQGSLSFASEIRPLLMDDQGHPDLDPLGIRLFLLYRYTPAPRTVLKEVKKLAPGCRLIVRQGEEPIIERWWNFAPEPFDPVPSTSRAEEQLLELYREAINRHLLSDVPLGLLLSGGMDSALLLSLMQQDGGPRNTYTVGYGASFADDELADAAQTAAALHAPNCSVQIDRETFESTLPQIVMSLEEPIASSSIVPMYHVCKRAREDVKVVFLGQGPDELFGGYTRHLGVRYGRRWRSLPGWIRTPLASVLTRSNRNEWIKRGLYALAVPDRLERYQKVFSIVPDEFADGLFRRGVLHETDDQAERCWEDLMPLMAHADELGGLQFIEVRSSLPDELLMFADKLSMVHGLEARVPYLDWKIVEFVERLPASFKVRNGTRKWLHRRVCKQFLPREILKRKKRGFGVNVVDDWFRGSYRSKMDDILRDKNSLIYEFLVPRQVERTLMEHRSGRHDYHKILFSLVALEQSLRSYRVVPLPAEARTNISQPLLAS